jgi:hypothetical protein
VHHQKQTNRGLWEKAGARAKDLPWVVEFDASAGVTPWMRWGQGSDEAACRVLIDGKDVTLRLRAVASGTYECGAGSQP